MKQAIKKIPLYYPVRNWAARRRYATELIEWERRGKPVPPSHGVKQRTLREYSVKYGIKVLVETGTFYGEMIEAMKNVFDQLYSIELAKEMHEMARARFKGEGHIERILGDSGVELMNSMSRIDQPTLFWLDSHYSAGITARGSKDTPIYDELRHILTAPDRGHVIIIDDAREFGSDPAYPSIEELGEFIRSRRPSVEIVVRDDSIRITPRVSAIRQGAAILLP